METSSSPASPFIVLNHRGLGLYPDVVWSTTGHTQAAVPIYARGPRSERFVGTLDNTDFFEILTGVVLTNPQQSD